jgi:hypothetical protein
MDFTLSENVNSLNNRYWCSEKPYGVHNFLSMTLTLESVVYSV